MLRFSMVGLLLAAMTPSAKSAPADAPSPSELSTILRGLLLSALPNPIVGQDLNWGHQKKVVNGITWKKSGILFKPHKQEKLKNDGVWRRIHIEAVNPEKTLTVNVLNIQYPQKGAVTFDVLVTVETRITFQQQLWLAGTKFYSGETRATCRPLLLMRCESTTRTQKSDSFLPDMVFRMRVTQAHLSYDQFRVEHTAGVGGDMAKVLGETAHNLLNQLRPSIERNMLDKASQAIVKAADTKDVKLSLGKLFEGK